jgi:hypothetical protein
MIKQVKVVVTGYYDVDMDTADDGKVVVWVPSKS